MLSNRQKRQIRDWWRKYRIYIGFWGFVIALLFVEAAWWFSGIFILIALGLTIKRMGE